MKSPPIREFLASSTDDEFVQWLETADQLPPTYIVEKRVNAIQGRLYHQAAAILLTRTQNRDPQSLGFFRPVAPSSNSPRGGVFQNGFQKDLRKRHSS